ncbi:MAG: hypothetical protein AAF489_05375 [Bacteroidota bacterium]
MEIEILTGCIILAGIGQIVTAIIYPFVRYRVLDWFADLQNLNPLNEVIAKTYGYYIQGINFSFGLMSILLIDELLIKSKLSMAVVGFMAVYWMGRISFQLKSYSFDEISTKKNYKIGIWSMNTLIVFFALTYLSLFIHLTIQ